MEDAKRLAELVLDRPWSDPDDDLAMLSRQLLRMIEARDAARAEAARYRDALERISNGGGFGWTPESIARGALDEKETK